MKRPLTLITALGRNKDLVLELIDFVNGGSRYHYKEEAEDIRRFFAGRLVTEIHLVCTRNVLPILEELRQTIRCEYPDLADAIKEICLDCNDISCAGDDSEMKGKVYEAVKRLVAEGDLIISSGGRKPVTQRLIEAGLLYGCLGYLTITAEGTPERSNTMGLNVLWTSLRQFATERRPGLVREEMGDNFRSLYLLPLTIIERLRREKIGVEAVGAEAELAWLRQLPKADLHCHLGGAYDVTLLKELASALLADLHVTAERCAAVRRELEKRLGCVLGKLTPERLRSFSCAGVEKVHCLKNLRGLCAGTDKPHICIAVLVNALEPDRLDALIRDGLPDDTPFPPLAGQEALDWYMASGDLGGSALLQTKNNLRRALDWLLKEAWKEKLRFLELRFSPDNYTRAGLSIPEVIETLLDAARTFSQEHPDLLVNFLVMATRHKETAAMAAHVAAAVTFGQPGGGSGPRITGFDLAGQEEGNDPARFQELLLPLHHHFLNITIHAGEMAEDDKIWQAIYLLHARRIGHGLKLVKNRKMMGYVRDSGIAIEMCPSSNKQTNGFRCFAAGEVRGDTYPLKDYLDNGLAVTLNTDNRGISRTTLSMEYLEAARLTDGGLSKWEILRLVKNGFKAAFLPKDEKDRLLKRIDEEVFSLVCDDFFPERS